MRSTSKGEGDKNIKECYREKIRRKKEDKFIRMLNEDIFKLDMLYILLKLQIQIS